MVHIGKPAAVQLTTGDDNQYTSLRFHAPRSNDCQPTDKLLGKKMLSARFSQHVNEARGTHLPPHKARQTTIMLMAEEGKIETTTSSVQASSRPQSDVSK